MPSLLVGRRVQVSTATRRLKRPIELAADKPFDQLMQRFICEPLNLEHTAIQTDDSLHPATGYSRNDWRVEVTHSFKERLAASGGLVTSLEDLSRFLAAQMQPGVFSRQTLKQLHTSTKRSDGHDSGTALGWSIAAPLQDAPVTREAVRPVLKKNGGRSNCSAWIGFAPEHRIGVAVITNCGGPYVDPIGRRLLEQAVPPSQKKLPVPRYARVAPYSRVRWVGDRPEVRVDEQWYGLVAVNGIAVGRLMEFANEQYKDKARKRLAEDLVQLLSEMGHDPSWTVTLDLQTPGGRTEQLQVLMTERNRTQVREPPLAERPE